MTSSVRTPHLLDHAEIRFGLGSGALVAVALVAIGLGLPHGYVIAALLVTTVLVCATLTPLLAVVTGATAWALYDGFAVHSYGELTFLRPDLVVLVLFVAAAVAVAHRTPGALGVGGRR